MLIRLQTGKFPTDYVPTVCDNADSSTNLDGSNSVKFSLWDTAGQEEYTRLRQLSYPEVRFFFIFFILFILHAADPIRLACS